MSSGNILNDNYSSMGTAVILAGGESKRLGYPKELIKLNDETLIEIIIKQLTPLFEEVIIVTNRAEIKEAVPERVRIVKDIINEGRKSSMRGLHAGLKYSSSAVNFVTACDMPFVNPALIKLMYNYLPGYDAVVPKIEGYVQPLYAFYKRDCYVYIEKNINEGNLKLSDLYKGLKVFYVEKKQIVSIDRNQRAFFNINTETDLAEAKKILKSYYKEMF